MAMKPNQIAQLAQRAAGKTAATGQPASTVTAPMFRQLSAGQKAVETKRANGQLPAAAGQPAGQPESLPLALVVTEAASGLSVALAADQPGQGLPDSLQWTLRATLVEGSLAGHDSVILPVAGEFRAADLAAMSALLSSVQSALDQDRAESQDDSFPRVVTLLAGKFNCRRINLTSHDGATREIGRNQSYIELFRMVESFMARQSAKQSAA
jgi:hypothetical protein